MNKAYDWYDNQKDPWRFVIFFFPAMFLIMGSHGDSKVFAVICVCALFFLLITRFTHLYGALVAKLYRDFKEKRAKEKKND